MILKIAHNDCVEDAEYIRHRHNGFMKQFNANFFGVINVTNAFLPSLRRQKSGTIVIVGSRHAWKSQFPVRHRHCISSVELD